MSDNGEILKKLARARGRNNEANDQAESKPNEQNDRDKEPQEEEKERLIRDEPSPENPYLRHIER